jgi:hypothetical protein
MVGGISIGLLLIMTSQASAEGYYENIILGETMPPTNQDWFDYYYHQNLLREFGPQTKCRRLPAESYGPLVLWPEIVYFTGDECVSCSKPVHQSYRGEYGMVHPMPYYIPNPTIAVEIYDSRDGAMPRESWRFPNNRVEITIGVWE